MKSIVEEKLVSFKTLEQKVFRYVCELAQEITRIMLENYDTELAEGRDKSQYRDKGKRTTTIKTVYGEVAYARRVYQTKLEDGGKAFVYLLDEAMQMDKIGLISTNLAEKIAMTVTESPYRVTADIISETCGQSISHGGAWNLIQRLGERINEEEDYAVKQMEAGQAVGKAEIPVLFEEMDGVWLAMQDNRNCLYWWSNRCSYGSCYDDHRAKIEPYDKMHPGKPYRTAWSNWNKPGEQAHWCRGGMLYPVNYCEYFEKYKGSTIEDCIQVPIQIFQDGFVNCFLKDSIGCEACIAQEEGKESRNGFDCE